MKRSRKHAARRPSRPVVMSSHPDVEDEIVRAQLAQPPEARAQQRPRPAPIVSINGEDVGKFRRDKAA